MSEFPKEAVEGVQFFSGLQTASNEKPIVCPHCRSADVSLARVDTNIGQRDASFISIDEEGPKRRSNPIGRAPSKTVAAIWLSCNGCSEDFAINFAGGGGRVAAKVRKVSRGKGSPTTKPFYDSSLAFDTFRGNWLNDERVDLEYRNDGTKRLAKHKVKEDHRFIRSVGDNHSPALVRECKHIAESSYRRAVQQTVVLAIRELDELGWQAAKNLLNSMAKISFEMRYSTKQYPAYIDDMMRAVKKANPDLCHNNGGGADVVRAEASVETGADRDRRELLKWIRGRGGVVRARDMIRNLPRFKMAAEAKAALQALVDAGHGVWESSPGGRTMQFRLREQPEGSKAEDSPLDGMPQEEVCWLWPGRIPLGKLTMLVGEPGLGKSFVSMDIAARVSTGAAWPDQPNERAPIGSVIVLNAEGGVANTIVPRLADLGANLSKIYGMKGVHTGDGKVKPFTLENLEPLRRALAKTPDCRLVVIDPISAYGGRTSSNSNSDVRRQLAELAKLAEETGVAIIVIDAVPDTNKIGDTKRAINRVMGSPAYVAASHAVWVVWRDPHDDGGRVLANIKMNIAKPTPDWGFRVDDGVLRWGYAVISEYGSRRLES